jgi:hypothetical protein
LLNDRVQIVRCPWLGATHAQRRLPSGEGWVALRIQLPTSGGVDGRFSNGLVAEAVQPFWAALQRGEFITDAATRGGTYRAATAHALACDRASCPQPAKLASNLALRAIVEDDLARRYSPEQIAGRLRRQSPASRRGGCRPRRSISRCKCSRAARCGAS